MSLNHKLLSDYIELTLRRELMDCESFLELGCGHWSPAVKMIQRLRATVGLDLFEPSLRKNKANKYFKDYLMAEIEKLPFRDNSFDCVAALDVLEHFSKVEGRKIIQEMERIAKKKIIILTPNGYNKKDKLEDENPLQHHKSGWTTEEFAILGYTTFGINGLLSLRGDGAIPIIKPRLIGEYISKLTNKAVYYSPHRAFQLLCVKNKKSIYTEPSENVK